MLNNEKWKCIVPISACSNVLYNCVLMAKECMCCV